MIVSQPEALPETWSTEMKLWREFNVGITYRVMGILEGPAMNRKTPRRNSEKQFPPLTHRGRGRK